MYCLVAYWRTCPYIAASRLSLSVPTHLKPVSITLTLTSSSSLATSLTHSTLCYITTMSKRQRSSRSKKPKLPQHVRKRQKLEREAAAAAAAAAGHLPDDSGVKENDEKDEQNTITDRSREVIVKVKMVTKEGETAATADAGEEGPGYEEYSHWTGLYISASEGDEYEDEDKHEDEKQPSKKKRKIE
jgi:hypothetical protein